MEIFKSVKTYIGLLSAIVGGAILVYQDTLKSGLLKDANDLVIPISLVFFAIAGVLLVLENISISKAKIEAEKEKAKQKSAAELELEKAKLALEKAKAELDSKKGAIIKGKGSTLAKAIITHSNDALIDAENSEGGEFEINNANSETPPKNEKKNTETE